MLHYIIIVGNVHELQTIENTRTDIPFRTCNGKIKLQNTFLY